MIFLLYLTGIGMAIVTGLLIKRFFVSKQLTPSLMEFPTYHWPSFSVVLKRVVHRVKSFVSNAAKIIIPLSCLLGTVNHLKWPGHEEPLLASLGQQITPLFSPMGLEKDNWPATVALLSGVAAKEVVVGTLNALYLQDTEHHYEDSYDLGYAFSLAAISLQRKAASFIEILKNPFITNVDTEIASEGVIKEMQERFHGGVGVFAYLLFVLLYSPCFSVTAVMAKEVGRPWTVFSVLWTTVLAYGLATLFYQMATFFAHPLQSSFISGLCLLAMGAFVFVAYQQGRRQRLLPTPLVLKML